MNLEQAIHWTSAVIGIAVFFQTLELISIRETAQDSGVWKWKLIRRDFESLPGWFRSLLDLLLSYPNFLGILALRLVCAAWITFDPHAIPVILLFVTTLLISLRWRGSFNGGSDFMNLIVLSALSVALLFRENSSLGTACLWYIAIQTCTSYFIAGTIKLRKENWRSGKALSGFLSSTIYSPDPLSLAISNHLKLSKLASWGVMVFECLFPLALLNMQTCVALMSLAIFFHLSNFYFFGLNRFLLSWAAAYPALFYCSQLKL
ncbi:MAG: HTTM domain-containing protein [Bdellovibrionia bacterium]